MFPFLEAELGWLLTGLQRPANRLLSGMAAVDDEVCTRHET